MKNIFGIAVFTPPILCGRHFRIINLDTDIKYKNNKNLGIALFTPPILCGRHFRIINLDTDIKYNIL